MYLLKIYIPEDILSIYNPAPLGAISVVACSFLRVGLIGYMVTASITSIADEWDVCCVFDILTVIG
jgi:uncharacterized membrane-anchored protein